MSAPGPGPRQAPPAAQPRGLRAGSCTAGPATRTCDSEGRLLLKHPGDGAPALGQHWLQDRPPPCPAPVLSLSARVVSACACWLGSWASREEGSSSSRPSEPPSSGCPVESGSRTIKCGLWGRHWRVVRGVCTFNLASEWNGIGQWWRKSGQCCHIWKRSTGSAREPRRQRRSKQSPRAHADRANTSLLRRVTGKRPAARSPRCLHVSQGLGRQHRPAEAQHTLWALRILREHRTKLPPAVPASLTALLQERLQPPGLTRPFRNQSE